MTTTDYLNGFQYKNGVLQFFPTAEGYVNYDSEVYKYVYNHLDHQGNVRLSYTADLSSPNGLAIMEQNHYYPFGMKHTKYNVTVLKLRGSHPEVALIPDYKYKYNAKEFQNELGLNWYDYGARNYDPAIGRWMNIDPLAEVSRRWSPYTYCYNNPVRFTDPDGMLSIDQDGAYDRGIEEDNDDWYIDNRTGKVIGQDGAATNNFRLIDGRDFKQAQADNGGSTSTSAATKQLQENSQLIDVNTAQIQQEVQTITDLSRTEEHQTDIVINRETADVIAVRGIPGQPGTGTADLNYKITPSGGIQALDGNLLIGNVHGHPLVTKAGTMNVSGTAASKHDGPTAISTGVTIYATDAYNTAVGGSANIGRVTADGKHSVNVGQTATFNTGQDALNNLHLRK